MTERKHILQDAINAMKTDDWYDLGAFAAAHLLTATHRDVLRQTMKNPVWDGDIVSKAARDELITLGLVTRCCYRGEQGYAVATYPAFSVLAHLRDVPTTQEAERW